MYQHIVDTLYHDIIAPKYEDTPGELYMIPLHILRKKLGTFKKRVQRCSLLILLMPLWAVKNSGSVAHTVSLDVIFPVGNSYWITKRFLPWPQNCVLRTLLPLSFETERIVVEWALCKIESVFIVTGLPCSLLITPPLISKNLTAIFPSFATAPDLHFTLLQLRHMSLL